MPIISYCLLKKFVSDRLQSGRALDWRSRVRIPVQGSKAFEVIGIFHVLFKVHAVDFFLSCLKLLIFEFLLYLSINKNTKTKMFA